MNTDEYSALKHEANFFDGLLFFILSWVNVPVHGCLVIGLSKNALDGFHIGGRIIEHRSHCVPEDMGCSAVEINCFTNSFCHPAEGC